MQAGAEIVDNLIARLNGLPPATIDKIKEEVLDAEAKMAFIPSPGPQMEARASQADILLFGGEAEGGKTAFGVGLALVDHQRSLLMRRVGTQLRALTTEAIKFNGTAEGFNGSYPQRLRTPDGRQLDFGSAQFAGDELAWRGNPHDYIYIDEAGEWLRSQIRNLIGWVRTPIPGQRTRIVLGSNPPTSQDGEWMVEMFAPWLDPRHPNPAKEGELRYFIMDGDNDLEVSGPGMFSPAGEKVEDAAQYQRDTGTKPLTAMSRTFIRSSRFNNPFRDPTSEAKLDMMPEPMRSAIRDGNFMVSRRDDLQQMIPTEWVRQAQARWTPTPPEGAPMCAMGVDIAQGGGDETVLASRYDGWFAPLVREPGAKTPTGNEVAGLIIANRRHNATIILDMGGGYGGGTYMRLCENIDEEDIICYKGASGTMKRTKDGKLKFVNVRMAAYWKLREDLDPGQPGGSPIILPPGNKLISQLTAMKFKVTAQGIAPTEDSTKEAITKRLGESTNDADAVVMCWWGGKNVTNIEGGWGRNNNTGGESLRVNIAHADIKRNRRNY